EHWVYVLESGGFWKRIGFDCQPHIPTIGRLCINGVIYYLAYASLSCYVLVSFDVRSEQFNMIQVPKELSGLIRDNPMGFIEYGGKPAIFDQTYLIQMGKVDLWVLEDGGAWSTKSLVLQPCQMHLLNESINCWYEAQLKTTRLYWHLISCFPIITFSIMIFERMI
ncbi:hypothetical protein F2Q68_00012492, partial [Brassica cretica]